MPEKIEEFRVESVMPAGLVIRIALSDKGLSYLLDFLSHSRCEFNGEEEPNMVAADRFVRENLFPYLDRLSEEIKRGLYGS